MENNINIINIEFSLGYVCFLAATRTGISAHLRTHMAYVNLSFFASTLNTAYLDFAETVFQYKRDFLRKFSFPLVKLNILANCNKKGRGTLTLFFQNPSPYTTINTSVCRYHKRRLSPCRKKS